MSLWTAAEAAAATGGRATTDWVAEGLSIDTRTIRPGDLFVALTDARDGHDFVAQALEKGANRTRRGREPNWERLRASKHQLGEKSLVWRLRDE